VEILAQSSTAFVLTHNFQGTHILGASRGRLSDSVASCLVILVSSGHCCEICKSLLVVRHRKTFNVFVAREHINGVA